MKPLVGIIMGSTSDWETMRHAADALGANVAPARLEPLDAALGGVARGRPLLKYLLEAAFDGGFDSIVHLAAVTSVLRSMEHPELTYRTNVAGTAALLEAGRQAGVTSHL